MVVLAVPEHHVAALDHEHSSNEPVRDAAEAMNIPLHVSSQELVPRHRLQFPGSHAANIPKTQDISAAHCAGFSRQARNEAPQGSGCEIGCLFDQTAPLFGSTFSATDHIREYVGSERKFVSTLTLVNAPGPAFAPERDSKIRQLRSELCSIGMAIGGEVSIPGDTGWIFAGYRRDGNFIEGPYVENPRTRGLPVNPRHYVEIGDTVTLTVSRSIYIVDYQVAGTANKLTAPLAKPAIDAEDETGVTLPKGTELVVRDVSEGSEVSSADASVAHTCSVPIFLADPGVAHRGSSI
jgi:hypothetical protein